MRRFTRFTSLTMIAALAVSPLAACGGGGGGAASVDDIAKVLVEQGAPEDEAQCVAEGLEGLTEDEVKGIAASENPEDVDAEVMNKFLEAVVECGLGEG